MIFFEKVRRNEIHPPPPPGPIGKTIIARPFEYSEKRAGHSIKGFESTPFFALGKQATRALLTTRNNNPPTPRNIYTSAGALMKDFGEKRLDQTRPRKDLIYLGGKREGVFPNGQRGT